MVCSPVSAEAHLTLRWYSPAKSAHMYGKHSFMSLLCRMYFMPLALLRGKQFWLHIVTSLDVDSLPALSLCGHLVVMK